MHNVSMIKHHYLNLFDILEHALHHHYIHEDKAIHFYNELEALVLILGKQYNHQASTSVSQMQYKRIWDTINYMFMHGFHQSDFSNLEHSTIQFFFDKGIEIIKSDVLHIKVIYDELIAKKLPFNNDRYLSILQEQIKNYMISIDTYEGLFQYCHVEEDLDYPLIDGLPLFHDMYHLQGSDLILYYVKRFSLEQSFCAYFIEELPTFIQQYEILKGISIQWISINLMELLLIQVIANILLHQEFSILLKEIDIVLLKNLLLKSKDMTKDIQRAMIQLQQVLNEEIMQYIQTYKHIVIKMYKRFTRENIAYFIYTPKIASSNLLTLTKADSSEHFFQSLAHIQTLQTATEKITYLKNGLSSVFDIVDLLENNVLFEKEYFLYFESLSAYELAIFIMITNSTLQAFHQTCSIDQTLFNEFDQSITWQIELIEFLKQLDGTTQHAIEHILNSHYLHK